MKTNVLTAALLTACGHAASPPAPPVAPAVPAAAPVIAATCSTPEHRGMDFWVGDWTLVIRARASADSNEWAESTGTQHIESILSGCAIQENFVGDAPNAFQGKSFSVWVAAKKQWRQTWVDDSGNYLAFTGGPEGDAFVLYGEPRTKDGATIQMRMVFSQITPTSMHWEWQQTKDAWATNALMIAIDYQRVPAR